MTGVHPSLHVSENGCERLGSQVTSSRQVNSQTQSRQMMRWAPNFPLPRASRAQTSRSGGGGGRVGD